eukprot:TRINITY_DN1255_c0_g1_i4.p5 TRINITY_DN1255_c0_g1~~TRINITY_DN1255_c0_g1_i4.p5  ORF type:complete len:109 (-),score=0.24 TRINITY_DN1255_c0_g1_i4:374-700(-)
MGFLLSTTAGDAICVLLEFFCPVVCVCWGWFVYGLAGDPSADGAGFLFKGADGKARLQPRSGTESDSGRRACLLADSCAAGFSGSICVKSVQPARLCRAPDQVHVGSA